MTRRRLTPDEIDLWHRVTEKTRRLHPDNYGAPRPAPKPKPVKQAVPRLEPFEIGQAARQPSWQWKNTAAFPQSPSGGMDRKTLGRMKRGKLSPEARLDLHGMTLERAHPELTRFILGSQAAGRRLLLVITGKGKPDRQAGFAASGGGVLKRQVPLWLSMPPLAQAVLQISPAHASHGGGGAYYIYLRKAR